MNKFDSIVPIYDFISHLFFGNALINSQLYYLKCIKPTHRVLIIGGGTGQILEHLPKASKVIFLDKSPKMVAKARTRSFSNDVAFMIADYLENEITETFNIVILPFFLDCFSDINLNTIVKKLRRQLDTDGKLLVTDFCYKAKHWMPRLMYLFFRITTKLDGRVLLDISKYLHQHNFQKLDEKKYRNKSIFSAVFRNL